MKIFIGLGNPGNKYKNTRHNLGQNLIKAFVQKNNLSFKSYPKLNSNLTQIEQGLPAGRQGANEKILLGIANEYMNNSGVAVQKIINFYKISPQDLFVIHDDLDLAVGEYRIQYDRGPAGHNGIKSIIENLGTQAFNRIRVGVGHPTNNIPVEDYVLLPFSQEEQDIIKSTILKVIEEIEKIIKN